jgi:phosphoglycolate phosphatase
MLVRRALAIRRATSTMSLSRARGSFWVYKVHKLDYTYVYPGVMEALAAIRAGRPEVLMAVLTNKPVNPSRAICDHFGLSKYFFQNYGGNSFHTKKPDPHGLLALIAEASAIAGRPVAPGETLMVGDSSIDVLTARAAGARSVGCKFGLAPHSLGSRSRTSGGLH